MNYIARVKEIIAEAIGIPVEQVTNDLAIGDVASWNSMANMEIVTIIQKELDIEIPVEDLFDLTSVKAFVDEVEKIKNGIV